MKYLITTIAAVVLVGCGASGPPEPPDISTHDAAKKGNPEDVKLHDAAEKGNLEAVKQHLAAGANVNAKDDDGWTPLHSAAFKGHKKIAELLIAKGASVNAKGYMEQTPLDVATHPDNPNDIAETTLLLRKHGGKTGKPAINLLQQTGDIELKAEALDISINRAASEGNIEAVKEYLADGADVNAKDEDGWTVLDNALGSKNEELINFVKANGGKSNADKTISIASGIGDLEAVKQHLATGADVNVKDADGSTPLHYAVSVGEKEVSELLIAHGADVNAKDEDENTPLVWAVRGGEKEVTELLIANGADVNAKGGVNVWTPLHDAASFGYKEVVKLLIAKGADLNAKDKNGRTPLDWTINQKHTSITDLLRKHGGKTGEELKAEGK